MHAAQIAHLDVKPPNVLLREGSGDAVLVDFGLAGRHLRMGCGSAHYGAPEVWTPEDAKLPPFPADVYAAAAVAYEVLTGELMFQGESLRVLMVQHFSNSPGSTALNALARQPELAPLAELLRAALARDPSKRPTIARLRAGFSAIEPDLRKLQWPLRA
jgi:serine/threonine protein kinase